MQAPRTPSGGAAGLAGLGGFEGRLAAGLAVPDHHQRLPAAARGAPAAASATTGPPSPGRHLGEPVGERCAGALPHPRGPGARERRAGLRGRPPAPPHPAGLLILARCWVLGRRGAGILDTTRAVNSALSGPARRPSGSAPLPAGRAGRPRPRRPRELVDALVAAWERADVAALLELLADDARFYAAPAGLVLRPGGIGRFLGCSPPLRLGRVGQRPARLACYQRATRPRFRLARSTFGCAAAVRSWPGSSTRPCTAFEPPER